MHKSVLTFLKSNLSKTEVEGKRVLEVGSQDVNGSPRATVMALGPKEYQGVDGQAGRGVDIVCSASDLEKVFGTESFDIVICTEMLEHVEDWRPVVSQLKRVVKEGGLLLITTRSPGFPYHAYPIDVWRYTKDDFHRIFSDMDTLVLEDDPQWLGVFLKARKPTGFTERSLAEVEVHQVEPNKIHLSWLIPTIGRKSLALLLQDFLKQIQPTDEIYVIGDGPQREARAMAEGLDPRVVYMEEGPTRDWGHGLRNKVMPLAKGTHIMSLDDDDKIGANAVARIKVAISRAPQKIHMFRMHYRKQVIWANQVIALGNVGTQLIAVPNVQGRIGVWGSRYEGDYDFIRSTVDLYPNKEKDVAWNEEIIVIHGLGGQLAAAGNPE